MAVAAMAGCVGLRLAFERTFGHESPTLILALGVTAAAVAGGLGPGLVGTGIGILAANFFLFEPRYRFAINSLADNLRLLTFAMVGLGISLLAHRVRRSQVRLHRSLAELEAVYDGSPVGLCFVDAEIRFARINPKLAEYDHRPVEEHLGRTIREFDPQLADHVEPIVRRVLVTGEPVVDLEIHEAPGRHSESERWWLVSYHPARGPDGRILGVGGVVQEITARKNAERELAEQRRLLERIAQTTPDILYLYDLAGRRNVFVNREATTMLGYSAEHVAAMGDGLIARLVHPDDLTAVLAHHDRLRDLDDGEVAELEYRMLTADGSSRWLRSRDTPFARDAEGRTTQVLGLAQDVTARREAMEELRQSEARFRGTFENAAVGMAHVGPDGRFLRANQTLCEITGYTRAELLAKSYTDLTHPDDRPGDVEVFGSLRRGEVGCVTREKRYVRKDGGEIWVSVTAAMQRDVPDGPPYHISIIEDISARKAAEARLRASEERLRLALEAGQIGVWVVDVAADRVERTETLDRLFWLEADGGERRSEDYNRRIHPEDRPRLFEAIDEAFAAGREFHVEYRLVGHDGEVRWVASRGTSRVDRATGRVEHIGTTIDITARKRAELELGDQRRLFERIAATTPGLLHLYDLRDRRNVYVNDGVQRVLGYTPEEIRSLGPDLDAALIHPGDLASIARYDEAADGEVLVHEFRMRHVDGTYRWLRVRDTVFSRDPDGRARLVLGLGEDVTERRRAEDALRDQAQQLALALQAAHLGDWTWDPQTDRVTFSDQAARVYDYDSAADAPRSREALRQRVHGDDRERIAEAIRLAVAEVSEFAVEYRITRRDGSIGWVAAFGRAFQDRDGRASLFRGVVQDITARKQAEELLRASEERLALAQEAGGIGTFAWDINSGRVDWSPTEEALYGLAPGTFGGRFEDWSSRIHPDDRDQAVAEVLRAVADLAELKTEYRVVWPDGRVRWLMAQARVFTDVAGRADRLVGVSLDITESKRAEADLREREAHFRRLAEAMPQIVWTAGAEGRLDYYNLRWVEYTGLEAARGLGEAWRGIVHPDDQAATDAAWAEALATGEPYQVEQRVRRADGTYRWHLTRALPLREPDGRIARWLGTSTDIEDQKRAEQALRDADRRKDEFLAVLAHELRNPLAAICNAVGLLDPPPAAQRDRDVGPAPDPTEVAWARDVIGRQAGQLTRMIDDLLDLSRIVHGKIRLQRRPTALRDLITRAAESVLPLIESRRHELRIDAGPTDLAFLADPVRLEQILVNLLTNAAKYTDPGGRISLTARREGAEAVVEVVDSGIGIPPEKLTRIFEIFAQDEEALHRDGGGLGIGLALVQRLVLLHGGSIAAESDGPGRGSRFILRLPAPRSLEPGRGQDSRGNGHAAPPVPHTGRRILIIDDVADSAQGLARLLRRIGHHVEVAEGGAEGLDLARSAPFDLILLDLGMPGMDGYEVAARLRPGCDIAAGRPMLVALTGFGQPADRERTRAAGFDHHLVKPIDLKALKSILAATADPQAES